VESLRSETTLIQVPDHPRLPRTLFCYSKTQGKETLSKRTPNSSYDRLTVTDDRTELRFCTRNRKMRPTLRSSVWECTSYSWKSYLIATRRKFLWNARPNMAVSSLAVYMHLCWTVCNARPQQFIPTETKLYIGSFSHFRCFWMMRWYERSFGLTEQWQVFHRFCSSLTSQQTSFLCIFAVHMWALYVNER
jgi:hypothetical protein